MDCLTSERMMPVWFWLFETALLTVAALCFAVPTILAQRERAREADKPAPLPSAAALAIEKLLIHDPGGWEKGRHVWHHAGSLLCIWVANKDYGLKWWIGGAEDWWRGVEPTPVDQKLVWEAILPIMAANTQDVAVRVLEALRNAPLSVAANTVRPRTH